MTVRACALVLLLGLGACTGGAPTGPQEGGVVAQGPDAGGSSPLPGDGLGDAGGPVDAGAPSDAGQPVDAGVPGDAGVDAGAPSDAGQPMDAGVDAGVDAGAPPPLESSRCPADEASGVGTNSVVRVYASHPLSAASVGSSGVQVEAEGRAVAGAVRVNGQELVFEPREPLPAQQRVQVSLSGDVVDTLGRPLAPGGAQWSFVTQAGPVTLPGFAFSPPQSPPNAPHVTRRELVMDGERALLAWSTGSGVRVSSVDGLSIHPPVIVDEGGSYMEQISFAVAPDSVHFVWTDFSWGAGTVLYRRTDRELTTTTNELRSVSYGASGPRIAAGARGELALVWDLNSNYWSPSGVSLRTSADDGETFWGPAPVVSGSEFPDVAYVGGRLLVTSLYRDAESQRLLLSVSGDGGQQFAAPVTVATTTTSQLGTPRLVDTQDGSVLVKWTVGWPLETWARRFTPATGQLEAPVQLTAPEPTHQCLALAATREGRVVLAHTRGHSFEADWVTELRTSVDGGRTFGPAQRVGVIDARSGCPALGYAPSGAVYLAWLHGEFQVALSRATPLRPCEASAQGP